jgi:hypothetical protein
MNKVIIDPCPTLKRYLEARAKGASAEELRALKAADEDAQARNQIEARSHAKAKLDSGVVIDFGQVQRRKKDTSDVL